MINNTFLLLQFGFILFLSRKRTKYMDENEVECIITIFNIFLIKFYDHFLLLLLYLLHSPPLECKQLFHTFRVRRDREEVGERVKKKNYRVRIILK